jgi:hypothetical protein
VGSKRIGQVRFRAISGDHAGANIPHLHSDIGSGEVLIELLPDGTVRLSRAHGEPIRGRVTMNEVRLVLRTARDAFEDLIGLWEASQQK